MKKDTLSYRIFNTSLLYFIGTLSVFTIYRIFQQEYLTVGIYLIGVLMATILYRLSRQKKYLKRVVLPAIFMSVGYGILFWFKAGGLHGGGFMFFTFILIAILVTPRRYSRSMLAFLFICQLLLVMAEEFFPELPYWQEYPNTATLYLIAIFVNMSIVWMLKYNYDLKEEKISEFNLGLRELHRININHSINQDETLAEYLNSGAKLFNLEIGLIVSTDEEKPILVDANLAEDRSVQVLSENELVINEIKRRSTTVYSARLNSNLSVETSSDLMKMYFIGTPLIVDNKEYGVLYFCARYSKKKRFEDYDIELIELMALNISQQYSMQLWKKNQQEASRALMFSDRRFKSIYDYANVGICVCDMQGKIVMANKALQDLLGFSEDELKQHTFYSISDSDDLEALSEDLKLYEQIILGEIDYYILEKRKTTKQGRPIYISKTVSTIKDENEQVKFTVMIADDITVRKAGEEKINRLNEELETQIEKMEVANKELESFSYSVSHDLRAPLRAIDGFSKIILEDHKDEFSEESKRLLNVIIKNSGKMAALIDDLLTFSRISRKITEFKPVDFNEIVSDILEEQALDAEFFSIQKLPQANGEMVLMKQVLSNLIGNAVKFSSKRKVPKIEIGCQEMEDEFIFYVKDNGVGFNMAYYDKIFGVFQRLHTEEEFKGTGVGLAIVQKVMMKHNGSVWAESEEGKGTIFYFSLPK